MPFHDRVVVLVDETTTGAGERIAAFAQERKLAPVVGTRTAGRLICSSVYKVGHGYFVRVPARAWYTWSGELLENKGVLPEHVVPDDNRFRARRAVRVRRLRSLVALTVAVAVGEASGTTSGTCVTNSTSSNA